MLHPSIWLTWYFPNEVVTSSLAQMFRAKTIEALVDEIVLVPPCGH